MTGYGRGISTEAEFTVLAEAKSLNSRYLDIHIRVPPLLSSYEFDLRNVVNNYVARGRVILNVEILSTGDLSLWKIYLDEVLIEDYAAVLERIESIIMPEETVVSLDRFLTMPEIFAKVPQTQAQQKVAKVAISAVEESLKELKKSRRVEGKALQKDIKKRISRLSNYVEKIKVAHEKAAPERVKKIRKQIEQLLTDFEMDKSRIVQESAILSTKADCTEEIVRLKSHINRMQKTITSRKPVGSLLNFIIQECHREINTIGSKTDVKEISDYVIDLKEECERIKEQVQNIE